MAETRVKNESRTLKNRSPFPGLNAYMEEDLPFFVGRDREKYPLLKKLSEDTFVSIRGANGVGKTSFVNCSILPELKAGYLAGGKKKWKIASFTPGKNPLGALAIAMSATITKEFDSDTIEPNLSDKFENILRYNRYGLVDIIDEYSLVSDSNVLLFLDQLDELIFYSEPDSASIFIERLVEAANQSAYPVHILTCSRPELDGELAMHSQFNGLINRDHFVQFGELISRNNFPLAQIDQSTLMSVFDKLTASGLLHFRPAFIDHIVKYYADNPIVLEKFQHALKRSIGEVKADKGIKTIGPLHLKTVGGINQSISNQLENIYHGFSDYEQDTCRLLFQALTFTTDSGLQKITIRTLNRLCELTDKSSEELVSIIKAFADESCQVIMVRQSSDILGRLTQLDTIHEQAEDRFTPYSEIFISREVIVQIWSRLSQWVKEESEDAILYTEIAEAARKKDQPYQGEKLKLTLAWYHSKVPKKAWALQYHEGFEPAIEFILESEKLAIRDAQIRKAEEQSRQQKSARNKRIIGAILFIGVILLVYSGFETKNAFEANQKANQAELEARKSSLRASKDSANASAALLSAVAAVRKADTSAMRAKLATIEAEEAKRKAYQLRSESKRLSEDVIIKEGELERAVVKMKRSREYEGYINILSEMRERSENAEKILTRTEDQAQLFDGARIARDVYVLFQETKNKKFNSIRDSVSGATEIAKKKAFTTMNLAIQKVKTSPQLEQIVGGNTVERVIGLTSGRANGIFLIGTNNIESNIYQVNIVDGEVKVVDELTSAVNNENKTQGIKTIAVANSKEHFIVSHPPINQNTRFLTSYSMQGAPNSSFSFPHTIKKVFPINSNDFMILDQKAGIYILQKQSSGLFNTVSLRPQSLHLRAVDFDGESNRVYLAMDDRNVEILEVKENQELEEVIEKRFVDFNSEITAIKYLTNQDWLVVGNRNGEVHFYNATTGDLIYSALNEHVNNVNCLEISPNGNVLVSGGRDKSVNIWRLDELSESLTDSAAIFQKYQPTHFIENESIRDISFVNNDWILVVSSSEGLISNQSGGVSLLPLDFDVTGGVLKSLLE